MTVSRYIVSISIAVALCFPAVAQVSDTYVIPAVARTAGGGGTTWTSSVYVFNPQPYTLNISITHLPRFGEVGEEILLELPANMTAATDNVLGEWFETSGSGSLLFATFQSDNPDVEDSVIARSFLVRSRTYNAGSSGGTYGQGIPGTFVGLLDDGISSIAEGVSNIGTPGLGGFRSNIGAVNLGAETAWLLVVVYDENGNVVGNTFDNPLEFPVHPYAFDQSPLPVSGQNLTLEFFLDDPSGEAVVFPYVSIVDNKSGDAVYVEPRLLATGDILYKGGVAMKGVVVQSAKNRFLDLERARTVRERSIRIGHVRDGELYRR
ncbi:MAG: hypothetical protein KY432_10675 [Acidobacteria bacterium]|nr:hypothetical protein [Acidobacteriota bacterium]